jgi:hypothetical protein
MPANRSLYQKAVLWMYNSDDEYGDPKVDASVEISCRWEKRRSQSVDAEGNAIAVEAEVMVDREIKVDSILWKGEKNDYDASTATDYMQVKVYDEVPDVKNRFVERIVKLAKWGDTLPSLA